MAPPDPSQNLQPLLWQDEGLCPSRPLHAEHTEAALAPPAVVHGAHPPLKLMALVGAYALRGVSPQGTGAHLPLGTPFAVGAAGALELG